MSIRIAAAALLLPLLVTPVLAQADLTNADRLTAIVIGFTADGTAMVNGNETANVTRDGPGSYSGTVEETGAAFTFTMVETAPCRFDATYASGDALFRLGIDVTRIRSFTFSEQEPQAGYTFFMLALDSDAGAVEVIGPDGARNDAGKGNRIGTSLTLAELNALVADLQAACPPA